MLFRSSETIDENRKTLKQLDESVDQIMARSTSEEGARRANTLRLSQKAERNRISNENEAQQKIIAKLNEDRQPFATEVRKIESEVGPLKYIAALLYNTEVTQTMLEQAVRWVIILIVLVFDPLAVLLVIAGNYSLMEARREKQPKEEPAIDFIPDAETEYEKMEKKIKKEKVKVTTVDPVPMNKEEVVNATSLYHRDQDSM